MILTCILLAPFAKSEPSAMDIEARARAMGMVYEDEIKAIAHKGEGDEKN